MPGEQQVRTGHHAVGQLHAHRLHAVQAVRERQVQLARRHICVPDMPKEYV